MKTWKSLMMTSLLLGTGGLLAACGDDEPGAGAIDANDHDAEGDPPDAMPPTATRAMTLAINDIKLTSPQGAGAGMRGGVISLEFTDLTANGGEVIFGTSTAGACVVQRFDATHTARPLVDAGPIVISGDALEKTVGPCGFANGAYRCISAAGAAQTSTATATGVNGIVVYSFPAQTFDGELVGSYLNVNGYATNATFNTGASAVPIIAQSANSLTVVNPAGSGTADTTRAGVTFAVIAGAGPIPTAGTGADGRFLGDETTNVTITKETDDDWGPIDYTVYARGVGFDLANTSAQPHEFPFAAEDVVFTCTGVGGDCGGDAAGTLEAMIVSGKTTDAPIPKGARDFEMPTPVTAYTTFQCGFLLADEGTIPTDAVTAILSTNPTRIETRVLRVAGAQVMEGPDLLNPGIIVVGHGLVGHSTAPAE